MAKIRVKDNTGIVSWEIYNATALLRFMQVVKSHSETFTDFDDYIDDLILEKKRYIDYEKKQIKREFELADEVEKEIENKETSYLVPDEDINIGISFDDPEFSQKIKLKSTEELKNLMDNAVKSQKYTEAALLRDTIEGR